MTTEKKPSANKWHRFLKLPPEQRATVLRAAALFFLAEAGIYLMGFGRCKELIEHLFEPDRPTENMEAAAELQIAMGIARAVRSVELHGPVTMNCLVRSMVLWALLRRAGIGGELRIGARKDGSQLEAHAWVELRGYVLNDSTDVHEHYARFDAPIAADSRPAGEAIPQ